MTYMQDRYARLKRDGYCTHCGPRAEAMPNTVWCAACSERHTEEAAKKADRWRNEGRCTRCGRQPDPGNRMCPECQHKNRKRLANQRRKKP